MNLNHSIPEKLDCVVCDGEAIGVFSSGIAPVSGNLCTECMTQGAENLDIVHMWVYEYGGLETAPDFSSQIKSYYNGEYITWPMIAELYEKWEPEIRRSFDYDRSKIILVDADPER